MTKEAMMRSVRRRAALTKLAWASGIGDAVIRNPAMAAANRTMDRVAGPMQRAGEAVGLVPKRRPAQSSQVSLGRAIAQTPAARGLRATLQQPPKPLSPRGVNVTIR